MVYNFKGTRASLRERKWYPLTGHTHWSTSPLFGPVLQCVPWNLLSSYSSHQRLPFEFPGAHHSISLSSFRPFSSRHLASSSPVSRGTGRHIALAQVSLISEGMWFLTFLQRYSDRRALSCCLPSKYLATPGVHSDNSIPWELGRNADSQVPPPHPAQDLLKNLHVNQIPRASMSTLHFEKLSLEGKNHLFIHFCLPSALNLELIKFMPRKN